VCNGWCDIISGEQSIHCGFKFASCIVANPCGVNITPLIVDFFEDCDNMCMLLSCAMNVSEPESNAMDIHCPYKTRFIQTAFETHFVVVSFHPYAVLKVLVYPAPLFVTALPASAIFCWASVASKKIPSATYILVT
jgi:hypothetical protein